MKLFEKVYDGESLADLGRDMYEVFDHRFNPAAKGIPKDEDGFHLGEFKVIIEWVGESK